MPQKILTVPTDRISARISNFTIGLARLSLRDRVEDATCAGSGTLVTIGGVDGLLTAAHVIDALPKEGSVGVVLYQSRFMQKQVIEMGKTQQAVIRGEEFGIDGPDLGFLRLPDENLGWLKATNSFYNLSIRREKALADETPTPHYFDAVVGMIDELTKEVRIDDPKLRAKSFTAILCNGQITTSREKNGLDLLDLTVSAYPDFPLPSSFEGMSGGALWRFFVEEKDKDSVVIESRLIGVPFHQSLGKDHVRVITCHGARSVYGALVGKIRERWREAR